MISFFLSRLLYWLVLFLFLLDFSSCKKDLPYNLQHPTNLPPGLIDDRQINWKRIQVQGFYPVGGWPSGGELEVDDIYFLNPNSGVIRFIKKIFESTSWILRTDDGGLFWNTTNFVSNPGIGTAAITDLQGKSNKIVASGSQSIGNTFVDISSDAGRNWVRKATPFMPAKVFFSSDSVGFITNDLGHLWKSIDGGITWNEVNSNFNFNHLFFTDDLTGIASVGRSIYKTSDGGITWTMKTTFTSSITFLEKNPNSILACGAGRSVYKSNDMGESWTSITSLPIDSKILNDFVTDFYQVNNGAFITVSGRSLDDKLYHGRIYYMSSISDPSSIKLNYESEFIGFNSVFFPTTELGFAVGNIDYKNMSDTSKLYHRAFILKTETGGF